MKKVLLLCMALVACSDSTEPTEICHTPLLRTDSGVYAVWKGAHIRVPDADTTRALRICPIL